MPSNQSQHRDAASFRDGDEEPSTRLHTDSRPAFPKMAGSSTASLPSLFREFAGLSISSRKSKSQSTQSVKEPDFSSGFSQLKSSLTKKRPKESRRHRSEIAINDEDIDSLKTDLIHERKLLRRALRELAELRRHRDELDTQRHKATSDLKRLREKDARRETKLGQYKQRLHDKDVALERVRADFKDLRTAAVEKDTEIEKLTRDGTNAKNNLDRLRERLRRERDEVARLKKVHSELKTSSTIRLSETDYDELDRQIKISQEENKALKEDNASLEVESTRLRAGRDASRQKVTDLEAQVAACAQDIIALTKSKLDLERARDLVEPILKIGVDIRLRNLELAREPLLKIKQKEKDRAIILSGNVAAHRANGAVDAALFIAGLIPDDYLPVAAKVFEDMYQVVPSKYGCWSPMILRMVDCQATVRTVQEQYKRFDTSHLREEHHRLEGFLLSRQQKLSPGEFEVDDKAKTLLARIEEIMEEIVDLCRGRSSRGKKIFQPFDYVESEAEGNSEAQSSSEGEEESDESDESPEEDEDASEDIDSSEESDSLEEEDTSEDNTDESGEDDGERLESESDN